MMIIDNQEYLTPAEAAEVLSRNSGRAIPQDYVRDLVRYGKLHPLKVNPRFSVYLRSEVESVVVDRRGGKHQQDRRSREKKAG